MTERRDEVRVPVTEERLHVGKREVETDRVRVRTRVDERQVMVEEQLETGRLDIARVPIDREVETAPPSRWDGDTLIVSLVEERLVVEKRLFVTEELHIRRVAGREEVRIPTTLRTMRAEVERADD